MLKLIGAFLVVCVYAYAQLPKPGGGLGGGGTGTVEGGGHTIQDETLDMAPQPRLNFAGDGVTCTNNTSTDTTDCTIPAVPPAIQTIFNEGAALTVRTALNFIGATVDCVDNPGEVRTDCTITGTAGTGLNSLVATRPIVAGGTLTDPTLQFGYHFTGTITAATYTVEQADCGTIKRFSNSTGITVSLPLLTTPCMIIFHNTGIGPVTITATAGDIDADAAVVLQNLESTTLSMIGTSFWRGTISTGRVQFGTGAPAAGRCDEAIEVGQLYMRTNAAAANASLYTCSNLGSLTYGWEGPFNVTGAGSPATGFADLLDFKAVATSSTTLTITSGLLTIGNYAIPTTLGGNVTFSGGSGSVAKVFIDEDGILVTEAQTDITTSAVTGQMTFRNATTPAFPDTATPICDLTVTSGVYTIVSCGQATRVHNTVIKAGVGLTKTMANGKATLAVDSAAVCLTSGNCGTGTSGSGAPVAANCNSTTVGAEYTNIATGGDDYRCRRVANATYLWLPTSNPGNSTTIRYRDDFTAGLITSGNGSDGNLQIQQTGTGTIAFVAGEAQHYGIRRYTSGIVDNDHGGFALTAAQNLVPNVATTTNFFARFVMRTDPSAVTTAFYCVGFCGSGGAYSTSHAALIYDTDASHTTWHLRTSNAGTSTGTDANTGVTVTAAQWVNVSMWSTVAGTICYSFGGASEVCHAANVPPSASSLSIIGGTRVAGTARAVDADLMEFVMWDSTR